MKILFLIGALLVLSYITATIAYFGLIPPSISETHYLWSQSKKAFFKRLFTLVLGGTVFLILPYWMEVSTDAYRPLVFGAASGLLLVATASCFKDKIEKPYHYSGACIWALCSIIWLLLQGQWIYIAACAASALLAWYHDENRMSNWLFYAESACVFSLIAGILLL